MLLCRAPQYQSTHVTMADDHGNTTSATLAERVERSRRTLQYGLRRVAATDCDVELASTPLIRVQNHCKEAYFCSCVNKGPD